MDFSTLENKILAGRFKLQTKIGEGGFGAVFSAQQISVGRRCAVKILSAGPEAEETAGRFENEARATSQLTHPNTVTIFDFGTDEETGLLFLAMEFLDGESLHQRIKRDGPLDLRTTVHIVSQIAASLAEAHRAKIVHRDIKPHNIMLVPREEDPDFVKVIDFGIAKAFQSGEPGEAISDGLTQTGTIIGTPSYMSTEQIEQQVLDGRSDQYALACMVFTMLSGKPPYTGGSPIAVATRHLTDEPPRLSKRVDGIASHVDRVLRRALAKRRDERFATITEFSNALADAADVPEDFRATAQAIDSRIDEHEKDTVKNNSEPPARSAMIGALLLVLVGAISLATVLIVKSNRSIEEDQNEPIVSIPVEPSQKLENETTKRPQEKLVATQVVENPAIAEHAQEPEEPGTPVSKSVSAVVKKPKKKKRRKKTIDPVAVEKKTVEKITVVKENLDPVKKKTKEPVMEEKKPEKKPNVMWGME